ncbi:MAG: aldehyde dehydrogenase [Rhizobacter sp.]|nr:aldehyde dehydrogenase [Rhizobacter sp.]
MSALPVNLSRRRFVAGGGALVMSFSLLPALAEQEKGQGTGEAATVKPVAPQLPGSLKVQPLLDGWIRIDADNRITVFTGKAELGQGIKTALSQVAAEELVVPVGAITLVTADTERTANEGYTAGSHSMQDSGTAIRNAAAQVRALLLQLAADKWSEPVAGLRADNGRVMGAAGRSASYGELVGAQTLHVSAEPKSTFRPTGERQVIGKPIARVDIPGKVTGGVAYVQDLRLPGMVHGRIVRPSGPTAQLTTLHTASTERLKGVLKVVRDGRFVGVVADKEFTAVTAMRTLGANAAWSERPILPAMDSLWKSVSTAASQDYLILDRTNGVNAPVTGAPTTAASAPAPIAVAVAGAASAVALDEASRTAAASAAVVDESNGATVVSGATNDGSGTSAAAVVAPAASAGALAAGQATPATGPAGSAGVARPSPGASLRVGSTSHQAT